MAPKPIVVKSRKCLALKNTGLDLSNLLGKKLLHRVGELGNLGVLKADGTFFYSEFLGCQGGALVNIFAVGINVCNTAEQAVGRGFSFLESGTSLEFPVPGLTGSVIDVAMQVVHKWLSASENQGWLLLVHNMDKAKAGEFEKLLPTCNWGSVVITTRLPSLHRFGECVEVEAGIGAEAGLEILLKSLGKMQRNLDEADNEDIPDDLFRRGKNAVHRSMENGNELDEAIRSLFTFSLTKRRHSSDSFSIHPLIPTWAREHTDNATLRQNAKDTTTLLVSAIVKDKQNKSSDWIFQRRILNHLNVCLGHISDLEQFGGLDNIEIAEALSAIGSFYTDFWCYRQAEEVYHKALEVYEKALGSDHLSTMDTLHDIASVFGKQKRYEEALDTYQGVLVGKEKLLESGDPSIQQTVNCMAITFSIQGRHDEALEWYQKVLVWREKALRSDHTSTLDTLHDIASVFDKQERSVEALHWYQRVLAGREKVLGTSVLDKQERYVDVLRLYERTLAGREKALGSDYLLTLDTLHDMESVYGKQRRYEEALECYQRELAGKEKILHRDDPSILLTMDSMAGISRKLRRNGQLELCQRALTRKDKEKGKGKKEKDRHATLDAGNNKLYNSTRANPNGYVSLNNIMFDKVRRLGRGSFGDAWLIVNQSNKENLVCKEILIRGESGSREQFLKSFEQECSLLEMADHPNIVCFISVQAPDANNNFNGLVFMEYCEGGDLSSLVDNIKTGKRIPLTEGVVWQLIFQLTAALAYMHHGLAINESNAFCIKNRWKAILHRDIKPSNVLVSRILDDEICVKFCDFGVGALHMPEATGTYVWTQNSEFRGVCNLAKKCIKNTPEARPSSLDLLEMVGHRIHNHNHKVEGWENCRFSTIIGVGSINVSATENENEPLERLKLLMKDGIDLNGIKDGPHEDKPLHVATKTGNYILALRLLELGAEVAVVNGRQQTALHLAKENGNYDLVKLFLGKGVSV
ncbi:hypothetical protein RUND412_007096 [Rhizina undulata]